TFTLAAAINENKWFPDRTFKSGSYREGGSVIRDHNYYGWGDITYREGIERSSNVAVAKLAKEIMGFDTFYEYLRAFRLDQPTNIELPGERVGKLLERYEIEKITTSFGQGSTVTAMGLVQAATAIANNGVMLKPYLVDRIVAPDGVVTQMKPEQVGTPITAETAKEVRRVLEGSVTEKHGTATNFQIPGYRVTGKTGTAQIPNPNGKGYMYGHGNYIYSFLGMAPADDPELLVYVAVERPKLKPTQFGAQPVSEIFNTVVQNSLQYLGVPRDDSANKGKPTVATKRMPDVVMRTTEDAKRLLEPLSKRITVIGNGRTVVAQSPENSSELLPNEHMILYTGGTAKMPNMLGWPLGDVMTFAGMVDMNVQTIGTGIVTEQSIPTGRTVVKGNTVVVNLGKRIPKPDPNKVDKDENEDGPRN
ncbi:MAG: penicillin-binding transpeptidase domain-containing protein, partial [Bacilli bacterium]